MSKGVKIDAWGGGGVPMFSMAHHPWEFGVGAVCNLWFIFGNLEVDFWEVHKNIKFFRL